ncbi:MAG: DUF975 family protein [Bacilli bacterium]|nr:DUF975 family protein [Bacilli bacterium]
MKAKDFRKKAWAALTGNWGIAIITTIIVAAINGALAATGVGSVVTLLVSGPLTLGTVIVFTKIMKGEKPEIMNLFDGFKNFTNAFLLALVNSLFIALWSLLLVIPGIVKSYAYAMSFYILNDHPEMTQSEARAASIEMMKGHKWELFCLHFSFIGWMLLSILTFGILMIWVTPYMQAAEVAFYQNLKGEDASTVQETVEEANQVEVL